MPSAGEAGAVLDHELLPEPLAELLCQQSRHHVDAAAGRNRYHHAHRLVGVVRVRGTDGGKSKDQRQNRGNAHHVAIPIERTQRQHDGCRIGWRRLCVQRY